MIYACDAFAVEGPQRAGAQPARSIASVAPSARDVCAEKR